MAKPELGTKRQCLNCGAKFYDLHRDPIVCPKCGTPFLAAALPRAAAPVAARAREEDEHEVDAAGPELVSLEDVEASESGDKDAAEDDVEIADDVGGDDTFLEEEEEGEDDVSGLIDSDLDDDEET